MKRINEQSLNVIAWLDVADAPNSEVAFNKMVQLTDTYYANARHALGYEGVGARSVMNSISPRADEEIFGNAWTSGSWPWTQWESSSSWLCGNCVWIVQESTTDGSYRAQNSAISRSLSQSSFDITVVIIPRYHTKPRVPRAEKITGIEAALRLFKYPEPVSWLAVHTCGLLKVLNFPADIQTTDLRDKVYARTSPGLTTPPGDIRWITAWPVAEAYVELVRYC
jgi:hypothetical protein